MKKTYILILLWMLPFANLSGQIDTVYTEEYLDRSTRFAWLTYGGDLNFLTGGSTQISNEGSLQTVDFGSTLMPRLTIGGIHFWGHTDFYVSLPLSFLTLQNKPSEITDLEVYQGVETGMRLYPLKLQSKRLSPFLGMSFRRIRFSQQSGDLESDNGVPSYGRFIHPIQFGVTFTSAKWHISASGYYNYQNDFDYYINEVDRAQVQLNPLSFNLSLLRYIDSDRFMRSKKAFKAINEYHKILTDKNLLSAWFFGIGPSSALQLSKSPFLKENFAYFYDDYSAAILPDLTFGKYFHTVDANINLAYRTFGDAYTGFNSEINSRRHSVGVESVKFLFNYLGFVPFVGPILSYENLRTSVDGIKYKENKVALGITFGWDIRVTNTGTSLLRTNLRYYPNLHMKIEGEKMMFNHLEFNFIQWVQFIGRRNTLSKR